MKSYLLKKQVLYTCLFLISTFSIVSAQTYTPVTVTGMNHDVIANGSGGTGQALATTTTAVDDAGSGGTGGYAYISADFNNGAGPFASALPANGLITNGAKQWQLNSYSGNNALRLAALNSFDTLKFVTPRAAKNVYILVTGGSGATTVSYQVLFGDNTSATFTASVADWYNGTPNILTTRRVNRANGVVDGANSAGPRLYENTITIANADTSKAIVGIKVTKTGASAFLNVFAVSINPSYSLCALPSMPSVGAVTSNSVDLSWTGTAVSYQLSYGIGLANPENGSMISGITSISPYNLSGLSPSSSYKVYVRSICGINPGDTSFWVGPVAFSTIAILCSGIPVAGVAQSSSPTACPSTSFTLSLNGVPQPSGMTYEWFKKPLSASVWTSMGAPTVNSTLAGVVQSETTEYYCHSVCTNGGAGDTANSTTITVSTTLSLCYCIPTAGSSSTAYYLNNINTSGAISNITYTTSSYLAYVNKTTDTIAQAPGASFTVNLSATGNSNMYFAWVDWNADGDFLDAGEQVINQASYTGSPYTSTITVPMAQNGGSYRIRFAQSYISAVPACGPAPYGNYVDFVLKVPVCIGTPATATLPASADVCPGANTTLSASGAAMGGGITYQWKYATTSGGPYTNVSGGIGATTTSYTTDAALPVGTYYFVLETTCSGSGLTSMSNELTYSVIMPPAAPIATNSVQCGVGIPTAFVTSNAGNYGSGYFNWYDAATGGNLLQGGTLIPFYSNDFNNNNLGNATVGGNAAISGGNLVLHSALTSQSGGISVNPSGINSNQYQVDFDMAITSTGGAVADGYSYSFGDDAIILGNGTPTAEHGSGSKLKLGFMTYNTAGGPDGKGIYLMYNVSATSGYTVSTPGVLAYSNNVSWIPTSAGTLSGHVTLSINNNGKATVILNGNPIFTDVQLPAAFSSADKSSWKHVISSRSGGVAGGFAMDNLVIKIASSIPGFTTYQSPISSTQTFYVSEISTGGCETFRTPITATVTTPPAISITNDTLVCEGYTLPLTATSSNLGYDYTWNPGNMSGSTISVNPVVPTSYVVHAVDNSGGANDGCNIYDTVHVTIGSIPQLAASSDVDSICLGASIQLSVTDTVMGDTSLISGYCLPPTGTHASAGYYIQNISTTGGIANINKTSGQEASFYANNYYTDVLKAAPGTNINFTGTGAGSNTYGWSVYIDWDKNGIFSTGERVLNSSSYITTFNGSFTIPASTNPGTYRMRVVNNYLVSNTIEPCNTASNPTYGETEDYKLWVLTTSGLAPNAFVWTASDVNAGLPMVNTGSSITATPTSGGIYDYIVSATLPNGCIGHDTLFDIKVSSPTGTIIDTNAVSTCGAEDGSFTVTGLTPNSTFTMNYIYNFTNVGPLTVSTDANGSLIFDDLAPGNYSQIILQENNGCTGSPIGPVTISSPVKPEIIATANNPNTNCSAPNGDILISSIQFSDLESYTVWYNGAAQGSFMPSSSIITVGGLAGGTYTDIHVVTAAGCNSDTTSSVDVIGASSPALITDVVPVDDLSCGNNVEIRLIGAFPPSADVFYLFNETVASAFGGANLTGDTMVIFSLPSGVYSDFQINDAGCLSNVFDTTLYLYSGVPDSVIASSTSSGGNIQGAPVGVYYSNTACELIANIESTDSLGNVTVDVNVGNAAVFTGTMDPEPYVGRYYSIHADENNGGTVTLFFDQADLDSYNTLASGMGFPEILSANGYADLRITAFHSLPGSGNGVLNYDTATAELITPSSVVWNATYNRLEVTFTVTQFSGFFAHSTLNNMPLPVVMGNIKAANLGATNRVDWDTKDEQAGDRFVIERSADARSFTAIGNTDAKGIAGSKYSFIDAEPYTGINYYRLQILGNDGSQYYSKVVHATVAGEGLTLTAFPNPVSDVLTVKAQGNVEGKGALLLMDASGRVIAKRGIESNGTATFDMQHLAQGMYVIKFADDKGSQLIKVTKK